MDDGEKALVYHAFKGSRKKSLVLYLLYHQESASQRKNENARARYASLSAEDRRKRSKKVPRPSTLMPYESPWNYLYHSGNIQAFITVTGLDPRCFHELLVPFEELFYSFTPYNRNGDVRPIDKSRHRGRPRSVSAHACLGMVLYWTRTTAFYWQIAGYFGLVTSCTDVWLRFGKRLLVKVLSACEDAAIKMPSAAQLASYKAAINQKHPHLNDVVYVGDGMKIRIQKAGAFGVQEPFYNGWKADHFITNLFVFCPDGTICAAVLNAPGNMHDSELATIGFPSIYQKLDAHFEEYGVRAVMDSAFCTRGRNSIIKSVPRERVHIVGDTPDEMDVLNEALSLRQSAEWGMRALQASMPRLKGRWIYEDRDERLVSLLMLTGLYNYRAHNMDLNQIRSVYWTDNTAGNTAEDTAIDETINTN